MTDHFKIKFLIHVSKKNIFCYFETVPFSSETYKMNIFSSIMLNKISIVFEIFRKTFGPKRYLIKGVYPFTLISFISEWFFFCLGINETRGFRDQSRNSLIGVDMTISKIACV